MVAPSGPCHAERVRAGAAVVESWGLRVRFGRHALGAHDRLGYLSADDRTRADDFAAAWTDPETSAVWAARGGFGAQRMVDLLDFDVLRSAGAKHFVGFSDITALHARIGSELGQVTVHGPVVGSLEQLNDPPSVAGIQALLMASPRAGTELAVGVSVVAGEAVGRLVGGNLSLVASGIGVEPAPTVPSIVVLEDIDEEAYRVDRMLTQLHRSGWFAHVVGVVLGDFTDSGDTDLLERLVADRLGELGVPVVSGVPVGHGPRNVALPLGAQVRLVAGEPSGRGVLTLAS